MQNFIKNIDDIEGIGTSVIHSAARRKTIKHVILLIRYFAQNNYVEDNVLDADTLLLLRKRVEINTDKLLEYTFLTLLGVFNKLVILEGKCATLRNEIETIKEENKALRIELLKLKEELEVSNKALKSFNGHYVQRESVHSGKKIAYKKEVGLLEVREMMNKGYTITAIADKFGVSRGLIYRRMKELESIEKKIGK